MPLFPKVRCAPLTPNEIEIPDLLMLSVTPGSIFIRFQTRKDMAFERLSPMERCVKHNRMNHAGNDVVVKLDKAG